MNSNSWCCNLRKLLFVEWRFYQKWDPFTRKFRKFDQTSEFFLVKNFSVIPCHIWICDFSSLCLSDLIEGKKSIWTDELWPFVSLATLKCFTGIKCQMKRIWTYFFFFFIVKNLWLMFKYNYIAFTTEWLVYDQAI